MGINLHRAVRNVIPAINPDQPVIILAYSGQSENEYFETVPEYAPAAEVMAQPQPVQDKTLQFLIQQRGNSIWHDFYLDGEWNGLCRAKEQGGDLLYWDGFEWLVDQVLERWAPTAGWTKVRAIQQRTCPPPEAGETTPPGA